MKLNRKWVLLVALVLSVAMATTGTLAYLTDTAEDKNTMTLGKVEIEQHEYERVQNADGSYAQVYSNKYEKVGYALKEFTQDKPLMPATGKITGWGERVYFDQLDPEHASGTQAVFAGLKNVQDKFVLVENTGKSDAYVRSYIALENGSNTKNLIGISTGDFWKWNKLGTMEISGNSYIVYEAIYQGGTSRHVGGVLPAGDYTFSSLNQIYLKNEATNEDMEALDGNANGKFDILVLSQAIQVAGFEDVGAEAALNEGFGEATAANIQEWFEGIAADEGAGDGEGNEGDNDPIEVPADASEVSDEQELLNALKNGGNYKITAPITVETGNWMISADTALYNEDPANVITFAQNARLKTENGADLALYGVQIKGNGGFKMENGSLTIDTDVKFNNDAILMANAGSTLTLGKGTVVENVVSTGPAVAWAKGTADNRATIKLEGATIKNCLGHSGTAINVDAYGDVYIEEGTVISNNVSKQNSNHGIIRVYGTTDSASTLTINGGEISNNYFSGNGAIGLYRAKMTMNGGKLINNAWHTGGNTNGFYCLVYVHLDSQFIMNAGEISRNTISEGVINAINSEVPGAITFNGGTVKNNPNMRNEYKDALAAVCYPGAVATTTGTEKVLVISDKANVTGTIYSHANLQDKVDKKYIELSEFLGN